MNILSSRHGRWAVPAALAATVAAVAGGTVIAASANPKLPPRTAAQLLVDLQTANVDGLSGTVVQNADLGLPALPVAGGGQGSSDLSSLVSGSHTLRVWASGTDKARVALLGTLGESDVIRNGRDVWVWSSKDNTATHTVLPESDDSHAGRDAGGGHSGGHGATTPGGATSVTPTPLTPQEAAQRALDAIDATTAVTTDGTAKIAGRAAYELVLAPKDSRSLIGQVRLAVDADRHIPLRVQVIARGQHQPAFEVGFTHLSLTRPDDQQFRFTPPPGAKVTQQNGLFGTGGRADGTTAQRPTTVGTGWTSVVVVDGVHLTSAGRVGSSGSAGNGGQDRSKQNGAQGNGQGQLGQVFASLPHVSGSWGSGRLLRSDLFTALVTDDGRLIAGFVEPELVYQAAAHR